MKKYTLFTDGGARGNPGPAAIGGQLLEGEQVVAEFSEYIGETTNNWAEYEALIRGLEAVSMTTPCEALEINMDSELIVKQMQGEYRVKDPGLKKQYERVEALLDTLSCQASFTHVPRGDNKEADRLVNQALDQQKGV